MFYSPFLEVLKKYDKFFRDFLLQGSIIGVVYLIDSFAIYVLGFNKRFVSLLVFIAGYLIARAIIRAKHKQKLFGGYANYGIPYNLFLASASWLIYLVFIRFPKFH